jgi:hypothetical protein
MGRTNTINRWVGRKCEVRRIHFVRAAQTRNKYYTLGRSDRFFRSTENIQSLGDSVLGHNERTDSTLPLRAYGQGLGQKNRLMSLLLIIHRLYSALANNWKFRKLSSRRIYHDVLQLMPPKSLEELASNGYSGYSTNREQNPFSR